jgi:hypothetical protein
MRPMRISVCCALGLCALFLAFQGLRSSAQEKVGGKQKAVDVLKEWEFPKAEVHGPYWPRTDDKVAKELAHLDLANQWQAPKEPMERVWKYYADKCGHKGKFPGPGAAHRAGTGNEKARYLMNFAGGSNRSQSYRCTFAYNTDRYMVFVHLVSSWEDQVTSVDVTVGTR